MNERTLLTLADWRRAYLGGASPRALLAARAERIAGLHGPAWIERTSAAQLADQVEQLETRLARTPDRAALLRLMPLFGVPFAVKDNIDVAGLPTTAGCPAFAHAVTDHAQAVQRLLDAGAVCLGKTNLDQFATGLVGTRSPYGRPASAFDAARVSGGSSSGSAVTVAHGDVGFALGTDTAGSGRVPAAFNHVVGLKPTPGRVSTRGVLPACRTLDCMSVFALTVADAATVLAVIEGPDEADAYSRFAPGPARLPARLRIGVPAVPQLDLPGYRAAWDEALQAAVALGHTLVPLDFTPLHAVAALLYDGPWVAERHAVVQELLEGAPEALDPAVRSVIARAADFSATDAFRAQYALQAARRDHAKVWRQADVLMVPTAPGHPTFAQVDADPLGANARLGIYTNFVNLLGWCALAVPAAMTVGDGVGDGERGVDGGDGTVLLPFGVTFIAPADADAALARVGIAWQAARALPLGATGVPFSAAAASAAAAVSGAAAGSAAFGAAGATAASATDAAAAPMPFPATEPCLPLAVVGAHLSGMPLNGQLTERGATLRLATTTSARYRLHALKNTTPPKPGLQRVTDGGAAIAVEVWDVPLRHVGSLLALVPAPLGLGTVQLADGRSVHGFICEGHALADATDVTSYGGWRAYLRAQRPSA